MNTETNNARLWFLEAAHAVYDLNVTIRITKTAPINIHAIRNQSE